MTYHGPELQPHDDTPFEGVAPTAKEIQSLEPNETFNQESQCK
jgi:hypothetical protein